MTRTKRLLIVTGLLVSMSWAGSAFAALTFTVDSWTANSLTFTVTGTMDGYSPPPAYNYIFTIVYEGEIWVGNNVYPSDENTWNPDNGVFDPSSLTKTSGGTTQFSGGYNVTSLIYNASLVGGTLPSGGHTVTVTFERNYLKADATSGTIRFAWGYPPGGSFTELGSVVVGEATTTTTSTTTTTTSSTTTTTAASTTTTTAPSTTTTTASSTTTTTAPATTTTTAPATTTTTAAATTSTTAATTTTTVAPAPPRPVPTLGALGIPLLVTLLGAIGMLGLYRRK